MKRLTFILWLLPVLALADPVPATNRIDWSVYAGVEGGIPYRVAASNPLPATATAEDINNALTACASNGVVQLTNGTYTLTEPITIPSFKTLRGVGSNTIIIGPGSFRDGVIRTEIIGNFGTQVTNTLHSGYTKGSSNITTLGSPTYLAVGTIVNVNEATDHTFNSDVGYEAEEPQTEYSESATNAAGAIVDTSAYFYNDNDAQGGFKLRGQFVRVTAIANGTNLTIWPPLFSSYTAARGPEITYNQTNSTGLNMARGVGIEDLTITNSSGDGGCVAWNYAQDCWVSNCWMHYSGSTGGAGVQSWHCFRITIQHCWFERHGAVAYEDLDSTAIYWIGPAGNTLVLDNIFKRPVHTWCFNGRGGGHALAYNYTTLNTNWGTAGTADIMPHGGQAEYVLIEGNQCGRIFFDSIHAGSAHYAVYLRNRVRGPNQLGITYGTGYMWMDVSNWWSSMIGNVCGTTNLRSYTNTYGWTWEKESPGDASDYPGFYGLRWACSGYNAHTTESNANTEGHSMTRWTSTVGANYDYMQESNHLDDAAGDTNIASSYLFTSKPSWFGFLRWPPVDPWLPDYSASVTNIPAGYRYVNGTNPPAAAGGGETPTAPVNLRVIGRTRVGTMRGQ